LAGAFIFALLLTPLVAHAAAPLQFQSPDGRRIVGAVEARAPIVVDGALDEEVWRIAEPAADFLQAEPHEGDAAGEPTEVRLAFDRDALYIGVVCHDREPSALIVNDIRKDFVVGEQDSFEVISRSRRARTAGTNTCSSSRRTTAGRCRGRRC
jgi:hypothetical protein